MADFTKKHYIEVARIIYGVHNEIDKHYLIESFARLFSVDNPRFDRHRWVIACREGKIRERANTKERAF